MVNGTYFKSDESIVEILDRFPESISRQDLFDLADDVAKREHESAGLRQLWVMTYAWGGGTGATGYRARANARLALFDARFETCLRQTVELLSHDDIVGAHESIPQLIGSGEGFFTKFLHFLSKPAPRVPLPLIYDEQVRRSLQALLGKRWAIPLGATMDWSRARIYELYVQKMNDWAEELGCTPEQLELHLFTSRNRASV